MCTFAPCNFCIFCTCLHLINFQVKWWEICVNSDWWIRTKGCKFGPIHIMTQVTHCIWTLSHTNMFSKYKIVLDKRVATKVYCVFVVPNTCECFWLIFLMHIAICSAHYFINEVVAVGVMYRWKYLLNLQLKLFSITLHGYTFLYIVKHFCIQHNIKIIIFSLYSPIYLSIYMPAAKINRNGEPLKG